LLSGLATAALLALLLVLFPVKITEGAGSLRCESFFRSLLGQSMSGCAEAGAWNLQIALYTLVAIPVATLAAALWEPRTPLVRKAVAVLLRTVAAIVLLFVLTVYAMAP
jgi:hypothetical protein